MNKRQKACEIIKSLDESYWKRNRLFQYGSNFAVEGGCAIGYLILKAGIPKFKNEYHGDMYKAMKGEYGFNDRDVWNITDFNDDISNTLEEVKKYVCEVASR